MQPWSADPLGPRSDEAKPDLRLVTRHQRAAGLSADLPAEHKSYLHRSGRTARAGNTGTVVTLITRDQVHDAKRLAKAAGKKR